MAHVLAQYRQELGDPLSKTLPFAEEGGNGGQQAWEAMKEHLNDEIGTNCNSEPQTFKDILLRLMLGVDEAVKKTQDLTKEAPRNSQFLSSFELMDIVIAEPPFRFNMHPIERTAGQWATIADAVSVVLCCSGLGDAIIPGLGSNTLCLSCQKAPTEKDYLVATIRCLNTLQGRKGGLPHATQLTDKIYWSRKPGSLFRDCKKPCVGHNLQHLDGKDSTSSEHPGEDLRKCEGAVIFGKKTKLSKTYLGADDVRSSS